MTTKVADKIIDIADSGVTGVMRRAGKNFGKVKKIVKKPMDKNAAGLDKVASGTGKVAGAGLHIGAGLVDISAAILLWLSQVFVAGTDGLLADNKILDFMKKKYATKEVKKNKQGKDKKLSKFTKNNPRVAAYLTWYLMLLTAIGGTYVGVNNIDNIREKKEFAKNKKNEIQKLVLDPSSPDWEKQVMAVHPYVMSHIFSSEGMIESAYYDAGQNSGTLTIGAGFTINDNVHRNFAKRVLGRNLGNGSKVTNQEAYLLASRWLQEKIYPKIKADFNGAQLDYKLFVLLCVSAYNKGESTYDKPKNKGYEIREAVLAGKSKEKIAEIVLEKYAGIEGTSWGGLPNKYAILVQYYLGYISEETILNAISEAPYTIEDIMKKRKVAVPEGGVDGRMVIYKNGKPAGFFVPEDLENMLLETAPGKRVTRGTPQNRVKSYLTNADVIAIENGYFGNEVPFEITLDSIEQQQPEISKTEEANAKGEDLFFAEKYKEAITYFEQAINYDVNNYMAYSNLIITYYKIGEYNKGIEVAQNAIESGNIKKAPKENKGYIYYNIALCYEGLGDKSSGKDAESFYKKVQENLDLAERYSGTKHIVFRDRLKNKIIKKESVTSRTTAFVSGTKKVKAKQKENSRIAPVRNDEYQA